MEKVHEAFSQSSWMTQLMTTGPYIPEFNSFVPIYYCPEPICPSYFVPKSAKSEDVLTMQPTSREDTVSQTAKPSSIDLEPLPENKKSKSLENQSKQAQVTHNQATCKKVSNQSVQPTRYRSIQEEKNKKTQKEKQDQRKLKKRKNSKDKNSLMSFICNRLVKFVSEFQASKSYVSQILFDHQRSEGNLLSVYFKYTKEMAVRLKNQPAEAKIRQLWLGPFGEIDQQRNFFHLIIRCLSRIYLERIFNSVLFESERFKRDKRVLYLQMKHYLLQNLAQPATFKSFKQL